jgi:hypothetical protein
VPAVRGVDINAQDRHSNTAAISAVVSDRQSAFRKSERLNCDLKMKNENCDDQLELANLRWRRTPGDGQTRRIEHLDPSPDAVRDPLAMEMDF